MTTGAPFSSPSSPPPGHQQPHPPSILHILARRSLLLSADLPPSRIPDISTWAALTQVQAHVRAYYLQLRYGCRRAGETQAPAAAHTSRACFGRPSGLGGSGAGGDGDNGEDAASAGHAQARRPTPITARALAFGLVGWSDAAGRLTTTYRPGLYSPESRAALERTGFLSPPDTLPPLGRLLAGALNMAPMVGPEICRRPQLRRPAELEFGRGQVAQACWEMLPWGCLGSSAAEARARQEGLGENGWRERIHWELSGGARAPWLGAGAKKMGWEGDGAGAQGHEAAAGTTEEERKETARWMWESQFVVDKKSLVQNLFHTHAVRTFMFRKFELPGVGIGRVEEAKAEEKTKAKKQAVEQDEAENHIETAKSKQTTEAAPEEPTSPAVDGRQPGHYDYLRRENRHLRNQMVREGKLELPIIEPEEDHQREPSVWIDSNGANDNESGCELCTKESPVPEKTGRSSHSNGADSAASNANGNSSAPQSEPSQLLATPADVDATSEQSRRVIKLQATNFSGSESTGQQPPQETTTKQRSLSNRLPWSDSIDFMPYLAISHLDPKTLNQLADVVRDAVQHNLVSATDPENMSMYYAALDGPNFHASRSLAYVQRCLGYCLGNYDVLLRSFRNNRNSYLPSRYNFIGKSPLAYLLPWPMEEAFRKWRHHGSKSTIFDALGQSLRVLHNPPPEIPAPKSAKFRAGNWPRRHPAANAPEGVYLDDKDAAHIIVICIYALAALTPRTHPRFSWRTIRKLSGLGYVSKPKTVRANERYSEADILRFDQLHTSITDALEFEPAKRLASRLCRAIGARRCFHEILKTIRGEKVDTHHGRRASAEQDEDIDLPLMRLIIDHLKCVERDHMSLVGGEQVENGWSITSMLAEYLRVVIRSEWDGKDDIYRWSSAGSALEILADLHVQQTELFLPHDLFTLRFVSSQLDTFDLATGFVSHVPGPNHFHLLSYTWIFPPHELVAFFRAINYSQMLRSFESSGSVVHVLQRFNWVLQPTAPDEGTDIAAIAIAAMANPHRWSLHRYNNPVHHRRDTGATAIARSEFLSARLAKAFERYLVLDVRRDHALEDAFDQLWQRERRELLHPLKVRMGIGEGEEGVDHGGVSFEFFRTVLAEALDPNKGLFVEDPRSHISWFRPTWSPALEGIEDGDNWTKVVPLYKFELIGLLFSVALYNGITVPVNFPLLMYKKLLGGQATSLNDIGDGWPELRRGLDSLMDWDEGDVADVFVRTYEFSYTSPMGDVVSIDMTRYGGLTENNEEVEGPPWPPVVEDDDDSLENYEQEEREAPMVTNSCREQFVRDYIWWLTDKSIREQFEAFERGFFTCIDRRALSIFTPEQLASLVQGSTDVDLDALERITRYEDGYTRSHPTIAH
ncbi:hypothetical protein BDY21DRAFT_424249, partial [Lineolata rhizophorae]